MHARESRTSSLQAERDDRREPLPTGSAPQQPPAARGSTDILSKTETPKTRPCGIIAPERTQKLSSSPILDLHMSNRQTWPATDHGAYKYTVPQNTAAEYVYPQRNISPRQTFQENMRRIHVPPRSDLSKLISEPTAPLMSYPFQLNQSISKNGSSEPKYCEVPYIASQIPKQQRTSVVRHSELYTSNVGVPPLPGRGWPSAVPPTPPAYYPAEYYGHQQSYVTAARSKVPIKKSTDQLQQVYSENLCRSGDVRFEPYHTTKDKYPRARYEYFPNSYHSYLLPPQKYDSTKPATTPFYVNYTPQKYVDPRIVDPRIADSHPETYVRPTQYLPGFTSQHPEYISSKFVPPSTPYHLQNKFYPLETGLRHTSSTTKSSYEPSRLCYEQDYGRGKPLQGNEPSYVNEMPPYGLRGQVPLSNYQFNNAQPRGINHMYQYRNDSSVKNYSELMSQYKYPDIHISAHNPLARIPAQFSPNVISPSESNTSMESVPMQGAQHEDCGYVSQCSTTSGRSIDYSHYKLQHYEHSTMDNRPYQLSSTSAMKLPHKNNTNVKHTKNIDIRQFLQTWDEDDDEDCNKAKDRFTVPLQRVESVPDAPATSTTSEPPLYVLGYVNIPSDEISKYEHIQKVCKLPENIRGYDNADLLNKFDEAFRPNSSKQNSEQAGNNSQQVIKPINESLMSNVVGTARAPSPFDVEAKITQSVIHKDVGCNFEIKPFSPPLQNVEVSLLSQNTTERKIEKIVNPNVPQTIIPNTLHQTEDSKKCTLKRQSLSSDEPTSNNKVMKTVDSQFSFNNTENKQEAIGKDYSTISGMCLASLPRLDNEIELNFQEINEQYSHLKENHESVIISTPNTSSLSVQEDQANSIAKDIAGLKTIQNDISKMNNANLHLSSVDPCFYNYDKALSIPSGEAHDEKNPMKLSKIRRNKLYSSAEIHTIKTPQSSPMQRTDSVIIKNPDNIENNSPILEDFVKWPHFVKQTSSNSETKQSSQCKPVWSSGSPNQSHDVNKCSGDNINHGKVTMTNEIQTHFTEILPLPGSKSPINLIMHSHNEEYTNCIRPSLIHCTPNESDNIKNARKSTDYVNYSALDNVQVNNNLSKSDINEIPINVAINLSINSNQSDLYSVNNSECHELKEIDKNEAALIFKDKNIQSPFRENSNDYMSSPSTNEKSKHAVSSAQNVFKEKNIQSPSNQTGEPKENEKSTSGLLNSPELTLQCFDQTNVYSDDSNATLSDKEHSNEYMTSQTTDEKIKHDFSSAPDVFQEKNIQTPSDQTGEPKENEKSTSSLLNSHELTLQCFDQANVYSDDSNTTLSDKEHSNEYMPSQVTYDKSKHDVSNAQNVFTEKYIQSPSNQTGEPKENEKSTSGLLNSPELTFQCFDQANIYSDVSSITLSDKEHSNEYMTSQVTYEKNKHDVSNAQNVFTEKNIQSPSNQTGEPKENEKSTSGLLNSPELTFQCFDQANVYSDVSNMTLSDKEHSNEYMPSQVTYEKSKHDVSNAQNVFTEKYIQSPSNQTGEPKENEKSTSGLLNSPELTFQCFDQANVYSEVSSITLSDKEHSNEYMTSQVTYEKNKHDVSNAQNVFTEKNIQSPSNQTGEPKENEKSTSGLLNSPELTLQCFDQANVYSDVPNMTLSGKENSNKYMASQTSTEKSKHDVNSAQNVFKEKNIQSPSSQTGETKENEKSISGPINSHELALQRLNQTNVYSDDSDTTLSDKEHSNEYMPSQATNEKNKHAVSSAQNVFKEKNIQSPSNQTGVPKENEKSTSGLLNSPELTLQCFDQANVYSDDSNTTLSDKEHSNEYMPSQVTYEKSKHDDSNAQNVFTEKNIQSPSPTNQTGEQKENEKSTSGLLNSPELTLQCFDQTNVYSDDLNATLSDKEHSNEYMPSQVTYEKSKHDVSNAQDVFKEKNIQSPSSQTGEPKENEKSISGPLNSHELALQRLNQTNVYSDDSDTTLSDKEHSNEYMPSQATNEKHKHAVSSAQNVFKEKTIQSPSNQTSEPKENEKSISVLLISPELTLQCFDQANVYSDDSNATISDKEHSNEYMTSHTKYEKSKHDFSSAQDVFKEKNIQSPSNQTEEPNQNEKYTSSPSSSHELTLHCFNQAIVYSDDSKTTLYHKENSSKHMTSQTTNEKNTHDVCSAQKQFNTGNILETKTDCNEDVHSSCHSEDQPNILVDGEFENDKSVDFADTGNNVLLLDADEHKNSCNNETINGFTFMTNSDTFNIKSPLKVLGDDSDDQLEENIENIALHIMASGNMFNNPEKSVSTDVQPISQCEEFQDPMDNSLYDNRICVQTRNEGILHNNIVQIESENKTKVDTEMVKYKNSNEKGGDVPSEKSYHNSVQVSECENNDCQNSQFYNMADKKTHEENAGEEKQKDEDNISGKLENIVIETLATDTEIGSEKDDNNHEQPSKVYKYIGHNKDNLPDEKTSNDDDSANFERELIQDIKIDTVIDINTSSECKSIQEVVTIIEVITEDSNLSYNVINENNTDAPENYTDVFSVTDDKDNKSEGVHKRVNDFAEKCDDVSDLSKSKLNHDLINVAVSVSKVNLASDIIELSPSRQEFKIESLGDLNNKSEETTKSSTIIDSPGKISIKHPTLSSDVKTLLIECDIKEMYCGQNFENLCKDRNLLNNFEELQGSTDVEPMIIMKETETVPKVSLSQEDIKNQETEVFVDVDAAKMCHALDHETVMTKAFNEKDMSGSANNNFNDDSVNNNLNETNRNQFKNNDKTFELNTALSETNERCNSNFLIEHETDGCYEVNNSPKSDLYMKNSSMHCEVNNANISSEVKPRDEPILNKFTTDSNNEKEKACIKNKFYSELHETTTTEIISELPANEKISKKVKPNQNMLRIFCKDANVDNEHIVYECDQVKAKSNFMGLTSVKVKKDVINNNTEILSIEGIFECCKDLISKECESTEGRFNCAALPDIDIKDYSPKDEAVKSSNQNVDLNKGIYSDESISNIYPTEVEHPHIDCSLSVGCLEKLNINSEDAVPKHREQMNELTKMSAGLLEYEDKNEAVILDGISEINVNFRKERIRISDTSSLNDSTVNTDNCGYNNCNISKKINQTHSKDNKDASIVSYKEIKDTDPTPHIQNSNNNKDKDIFVSNILNQTFSKRARFTSNKYKRGIIFDTYFSNKGQNSKNSILTSDVDDFIKSQMSLIKKKNRNTRWDKKLNTGKEQSEKDTMNVKCDNENSQSKINNLYTHCQLTSEDSTNGSIGKQETSSPDLNNTELSSHLSFIFENLSRKRRISHNYQMDTQNKCSRSNICQHKQINNYEYTTPVPETRTTQYTHPRNITKVAKLFLDDKESENVERIRILSDDNKIERNIDSDTYLSKWINIDNENITSLILGEEKQIPKVVETLSKTNKSNERKQNVNESEYLTFQEKTCSEHNDEEFFIKNDNNSDNLISLTNIIEDIKSEPLYQKPNKENDMRVMKLPVNINAGSICSEKFGLYDELWTDTEVSVHSNEIKLNKGCIKQHQDKYSKNFGDTFKLLPQFIEDLPLQQNINEKQSCNYLVVETETETALNSINEQNINSSSLRNEDPEKKANEKHITSGVEEKSCCTQISDKNYDSEYAENNENSSTTQNFRITESCDKKVDKIKQNSHELNIKAQSLCTCENSENDMNVKELNMDYTDAKEYYLAADFNVGMKEDFKNEGDSSDIKTFAVPIEQIVCMEPDSTQECHGQEHANLNKKIKNIGLNLKHDKEFEGSNENIENVSENILCEISNDVCDMNSKKNKDRYSEELEECDSSQAYEYSNEVELCKTPHSPIHRNFFDSEASCNLDDSIENQEVLLIEDECVVTDNMQIIDEYNIETASNNHCSDQDSEMNVLQLILHSPTPFNSEYKVITSPDDLKNCEISTSDNCEEIWIDDVACIETVVSEEVEQENDSDCPEYHSPTDVQHLQLTDLGSNERINYDLSLCFDSTKLKDIYGDNMDNNDIHLVETLYRTPHMDVRSKLNESECKVRKSKQNFASNSCDENSHDCVIFAQQTNKGEHDFNSEHTPTSNPHSNMSHNNKQANTIQAASNCMGNNEDQKDNNFDRKINNDDENSVHSNLSNNANSELINAYSPRVSIQNVTSDSSDENNDQKCNNVTRKIKNKGKNYFHSSLSYKKRSHIVHKFKKSMFSDEIDSAYGNNFENDNFQAKTYQSHKHSRVRDNRHTDLALNIYSSADVGSSDNTKKSDSITVSAVSKVSNSNYLSRRTDKLITKAAQKYVPPLHISAHNLKVQLPLPEENLRRLQHLKVNNQEHERSPIPKLKIITSHVHKNNVNLCKKKIKPKFEDVLKHIDDAQYKLNIKHRNKKKTDKAVPKVIIKKNGSQYTSTSPAVKPNFNPDLTGSRWQPCVSLERYPLIDKMLAKRKTKVTFCSLTGKFVIQQKSYKIKDLTTAPQYSIEGVKEKPLKCTISYIKSITKCNK